MNLDNTKALSFDCYGTLIDWETGLNDALQAVLVRHGLSMDKEELLEKYARIEASEEARTYRNYKSVLITAMKTLGNELEFVPTEEECAIFSRSVASWPPFADTVEALGRLKQKFRLVIISNVDDDLFAGTNGLLQVEFDEIITAEQVRAYKPSLKPFEVAFERIGLPIDEILHVAQSVYHDIGPARKLGLRTVWINRRLGKTGAGATPEATATPDFELPSMSSLADLLSG